MDMTTIIDPRQSNKWRRISATPVDKWIMGVDLGQSTDPTAICVMHHRVVPLDTWSPNAKGECWKQDRTESFDVRHLQRLPLGMAYPDQIERVAIMLQRPPLDAGCRLVIDETGVGRPVGDLMDRAGLHPTRVTITAGLEVTSNGVAYHVPKGVLISGLDARLHTGELRIASEVAEAGALQEELKDFQRSVSAAGRATWSARTGKHDDLILATAIALWLATSEPQSSCEELRF